MCATSIPCPHLPIEQRLPPEVCQSYTPSRAYSSTMLSPSCVQGDAQEVLFLPKIARGMSHKRRREPNTDGHGWSMTARCTRVNFGVIAVGETVVRMRSIELFAGLRCVRLPAGQGLDESRIPHRAGVLDANVLACAVLSATSSSLLFRSSEATGPGASPLGNERGRGGECCGSGRRRRFRPGTSEASATRQRTMRSGCHYKIGRPRHAAP